MSQNAKEAAHRAASDAEQIAWVDEQDNLLGALVRQLQAVDDHGQLGNRVFRRRRAATARHFGNGDQDIGVIHGRAASVPPAHRCMATEDAGTPWPSAAPWTAAAGAA